jgi:hypothetical protein
MFTSGCSWIVRIEREERFAAQYRAQSRVLPPMLPVATAGRIERVVRSALARMLAVAARA